MAWPRDQPSSSGGGGASTAQDPVTEEPPTATEVKTTPAQTPQPSPPSVPVPEEIQPSTLDLNEDQPQEKQDVLNFCIMNILV